MHPNPARDEIKFETNEPIKEIQVFDLTGKKYALEYDIHDSELHVQVGHLLSGFYIFEIRTVSGIMRKPCIINR